MGLISYISNSRALKGIGALVSGGAAFVPTAEMLNPPAIYAQSPNVESNAVKLAQLVKESPDDVGEYPKSPVRVIGNGTSAGIENMFNANEKRYNKKIQIGDKTIFVFYTDDDSEKDYVKRRHKNFDGIIGPGDFLDIHVRDQTGLKYWDYNVTISEKGGNLRHAAVTGKEPKRFFQSYSEKDQDEISTQYGELLRAIIQKLSKKN